MFVDDYAQNGLLGHVKEATEFKDVIPVFRAARFFTTGQMIVFLNPITGLKTAGPVKVQTYDNFGERLVVDINVSVSQGDAVYLSGSQDERNPPRVGSELFEQEKDV